MYRPLLATKLPSSSATGCSYSVIRLVNFLASVNFKAVVVSVKYNVSNATPSAKVTWVMFEPVLRKFVIFSQEEKSNVLFWFLNVTLHKLTSLRSGIPPVSVPAAAGIVQSFTPLFLYSFPCSSRPS